MIDQVTAIQNNPLELAAMSARLHMLESTGASDVEGLHAMAETFLPGDPSNMVRALGMIQLGCEINRTWNIIGQVEARPDWRQQASVMVQLSRSNNG